MTPLAWLVGSQSRVAFSMISRNGTDDFASVGGTP